MEFPYTFRKYQREMVSVMSEGVRGKHLVLESGTGTGKTICALFSTLNYCLPNGKVVLYLVRTNSQQRQVILELRRLGVYGLGIQGRQNMCLLARSDEELSKGTAEELSKLCQERKSKTLRGREGCPYYAKLMKSDIGKIRKWAKDNIPTAEEMLSYCSKKDICPYEMNKILVPDAKVITSPYVYFFNPFIRNSLLEWMNRPLSEVVLVVDEAHNLPEYAREIRSAELSLRSIDLVKKEAIQHGDAEVLDGISIIDVCSILQRILLSLSEEYVIDEDGLLPPSALEEEIMHSLTITSSKLEVLAENLVVYGEIIREKRKREGKLPRSYIHSLGSFLLFWMKLEGGEYVKLVHGGDNPSLEGYCLDPSLATSVVKDCHSSIHMSGTLSPLDEYRDSIGLPDDAILKELPSPFPEENRIILYTEDTTTKYEELLRDGEMFSKIKDHILEIVNSTERNTVVFFPSHNLLRQFLNSRKEIRRRVYVEEKEMKQEELMKQVSKFKGSKSILFAVVGGRISEGIDFPDKELEIAVLVGVPYPKPTAKQKALLHYYDVKFNKGWDYSVRAPTTRKMLQSIGRLIRKEDDRGVAIILDRRAVHFKDSLKALNKSEDLVADIKFFFEKE